MVDTFTISGSGIWMQVTQGPTYTTMTNSDGGPSIQKGHTFRRISPLLLAFPCLPEGNFGINPPRAIMGSKAVKCSGIPKITPASTQTVSTGTELANPVTSSPHFLGRPTPPQGMTRTSAFRPEEGKDKVTKSNQERAHLSVQPMDSHTPHMRKSNTT